MIDHATSIHFRCGCRADACTTLARCPRHDEPSIEADVALIQAGLTELHRLATFEPPSMEELREYEGPND